MMEFVTLNGITLHYRQEGVPGALPLVFINSLGWDLRVWEDVVARLWQSAAIVRFDKRGHGLSDCSPVPYSIEGLAGDMAGLLAHLNIESAILAGTSVGGMIALKTALAFPQRVKALILCDTAAKIGTDEFWQERINTLREHGLSYLADAILSRWFAPAFAGQHPAKYRGFYNLLTRMPLEGYIGMCEVLRTTDLRDSVGNMAVPALVLCGAEDAATPPDLVKSLADTLPDARFELIAGAGHTPSIEQPEAVADAILRFLKERGYVR